MRTSLHVPLAVLALALCPAGLDAQRTVGWTDVTPKVLLDVRQLERADDGELVWQPFEAARCGLCDGEKTTPCSACRNGEHDAADNCAECRGRRRVPCGRCVGTGKTLDPFVEMPCPSCAARVRIPCRVCLGVGRRDIAGGGTPSCVPCGAAGGHRCSTCRGRREIAVLKVGRTPLHEADDDGLAELGERLAALQEDVDAFLALVTRVRPKPPAPEELPEPFAALMAKAGELDSTWRREPRTVAAIADSLRKYDSTGVFTTRNLDHPTTIRLEYRRSAEGLGQWLAFHVEAVGRCRRRHARNERR